MPNDECIKGGHVRHGKGRSRRWRYELNIKPGTELGRNSGFLSVSALFHYTEMFFSISALPSCSPRHFSKWKVQIWEQLPLVIELVKTQTNEKSTTDKAKSKAAPKSLLQRIFWKWLGTEWGDSPGFLLIGINLYSVGSKAESEI